MEGILERTATVPAPIDEVFGFFADAANLEALTPPELRFRILSPLPIEMRAGALIDYRLRLWGVPIRWRTHISEWKPGERFVDEQLRGPYRSWVHTHAFEDLGDRTRVHDHVRYALPFRPFGQLALPAVRRQLDRIFDYRQRVIGERFGCA